MLEGDYSLGDTVIDISATTEEERNKQLSTLQAKLRQNTFNPSDYRIVVINEVADLKDSSIRLLKTTLDGLKRRKQPVLLFTTANEELDALPVVERGTTVHLDYPPAEALLEFGKKVLAEEKVKGVDERDIRDCITASSRSVRMFLSRGHTGGRRRTGGRSPRRRGDAAGSFNSDPRAARRSPKPRRDARVRRALQLGRNDAGPTTTFPRGDRKSSPTSQDVAPSGTAPQPPSSFNSASASARSEKLAPLDRARVNTSRASLEFPCAASACA